MNYPVAIFGPSGERLPGAVFRSRKVARRWAARTFGTKWHNLWKKGYKVRWYDA